MSFHSVESRRGGLCRAAAALLAAGAFLWWSPPSHAGRKKGKYIPYTVVPDVARGPGSPELRKVQIHREGVTAEVSYVTGAARRWMMAATLGIDDDPFAMPAGQEPFFHTFLVSLENTSPRQLLFNPSTCQIVTDKSKVAYAMDYTALYERIGRSSGLTLDQVHRITYDRTLTLPPGAKARKLLVFERWIGKWKGFTLGMTLEADGLTLVDLSVPFRKEILGETP